MFVFQLAEWFNALGFVIGLTYCCCCYCIYKFVVLTLIWAQAKQIEWLFCQNNEFDMVFLMWTFPWHLSLQWSKLFIILLMSVALYALYFVYGKITQKVSQFTVSKNFFVTIDSFYSKWLYWMCVCWSFTSRPIHLNPPEQQPLTFALKGQHIFKTHLHQLNHQLGWTQSEGQFNFSPFEFAFQFVCS